MNKLDKQKITGIVVELTWDSAGGSSSEVAAYSRCVRTLLDTFPLSDDDLHFSYAWAILRMATSVTPTDEDMDALLALFDADGYETVSNFIEDAGFDDLMRRVRA